jgi:hypothetical protein
MECFYRTCEKEGDTFMAWDPNQGQPSSGQDPYSGYGAPQNPYGTPPQNPYETPQNPYGTPPPNEPGYGAAYAIPTATPLPLGEAIQQLPMQYLKVLSKPSADTFEEEMGKADWGIVWIQLMGYAVIASVLGYLSTLTNGGALTSTTTGSGGAISPAVVQAITAGTSFGSIIVVPISFFIGVGLVYLFAKLFGGQGKFLTQCYTTLLYTVPLGIITSVIALIPVIGGFGSILNLYGIVLNIFSVMAVHRLTGGKATAAVLLPVAILLLLFCVLIAVLISIFAAAIRSTQP